MRLPKSIEQVINSFEKLPGVGPKSAQRLAFYLLHVPQEQLDEFSDSLLGLKKNTILCSVCCNVSEKDPCPVCSDQTRNKNIICVVENPLDILALERSGQYNGIYHVLHGAISPLNNIGPDELFIQQLLVRIKNNPTIEEIIIATNPNMEGEATAMYLAKKLGELIANSQKLKALKVTRLGQGLPTGADLEYADDTTLRRALEGRREY